MNEKWWKIYYYLFLNIPFVRPLDSIWKDIIAGAP
jgi:hypothetical protein